ncbi:uncharacterized protein LAJ45_09932 [Morchella importuna]|uniref:uncharacterized protein n=1 Tax=Morchella importuna TaxID=1174673 RepID=UPI001E8EB2B5|nr:uncharacterized protein LAJ45_09932 [Morchella importuna]KAH8146010.1 hypothetical protein LAJ45_09932 [Morchella importuna]
MAHTRGEDQLDFTVARTVPESLGVGIFSMPIQAEARWALFSTCHPSTATSTDLEGLVRPLPLTYHSDL